MLNIRIDTGGRLDEFLQHRLSATLLERRDDVNDPSGAHDLTTHA